MQTFSLWLIGWSIHAFLLFHDLQVLKLFKPLLERLNWGMMVYHSSYRPLTIATFMAIRLILRGILYYKWSLWFRAVNNYKHNERFRGPFIRSNTCVPNVAFVITNIFWIHFLAFSSFRYHCWEGCIIEILWICWDIVSIKDSACWSMSSWVMGAWQTYYTVSSEAQFVWIVSFFLIRW